MDNHISSGPCYIEGMLAKNNPRFSEAIIEHYKINDSIYKNNPCSTKQCSGITIQYYSCHVLFYIRQSGRICFR